MFLAARTQQRSVWSCQAFQMENQNDDYLTYSQ